MAGAAIDRDRIPRLADANAVDLARGERVGREGRAGNDDLDIGIGLDADPREPVAEHVIVARIAVDGPEAQRIARRLARGPDALPPPAQPAAIAARPAAPPPP